MRGSKVCGQVMAAIAHAGLIIILSIAVVRAPSAQLMEPVPEPQEIKIGEQLLKPPETTEREPEEEALPPVGEDVEEPKEPKEVDAADDPNMIPPLEEDLPKPKEFLPESALKGLPGEPHPDTDPADLKNIRKGPESSGIPEMLGEPLDGDTVFLVDLSGSMADPYGNTTRFLAVAAELAMAISTLREEDSFDIIAFSGSYQGGVRSLWGSTQSATSERKSEATDWLNSLVPNNGTPTLEALQHFSGSYPASVDNLVLVTDGIPNAGTSDIILGNIERLLAHFDDLGLICISISSEGLPFVKRLVDKVGGTYVLVD